MLTVPDGTREIVARWQPQHREIGARDLPVRSWHFAKLKTASPVIFTSASGKAGIIHSIGAGVFC